MRRLYVVLPLVVTAIGIAVFVWNGGLLLNNPPPPQQEVSVGLPAFEDVAAAVGVHFQHFDPATPQHLMPETMGSGVAWIDYDADGWQDLFCVQDGPLPPAKRARPPTHKLFRNNRNGTFVDVTETSGLAVAGFGVGVAVGDYDNDGFDDLLVTLLNGISLFHNEPAPGGGRRFTDVTGTANLSNPHYGTSAAWGDFDGDGFLDLYVCNYVEIDPDKPLLCKQGTVPIQCAPTAFPLARHQLYRNNRNGTFTNVTADSGVATAPLAPGLGVITLDVDADGRQDIYVANDLHPAYLFRNLGDWKFEEIALPSGCGLGVGGSRMAGMGVDVVDLGTGRPSLVVTNYQNSPNILFENRGPDARGLVRFSDATNRSGLGPPSLSRLGFGCVFIDADLDGRPDLAVANGHVQRPSRKLFGVDYPQPAQMFVGDGTGHFRDVSGSAGDGFLKPRVGRGLARCDYDHDGKPDLALSAVGDVTAVLRNVTATKNQWVSLELIGDGRTGNRNAIGAAVRVEWAGGSRTYWLAGGGSYLSASDRRMNLGLGPEATKLDRVTVRWAGGKTQEFRDLAAGGFWRLREGNRYAERFAPPGP